jgi:hypothetical protein
MGAAIFLTKRFIDICEENKLVGLACHKITEYEEPVGLSEDKIVKDLCKSRKMMGWED